MPLIRWMVQHWFAHAFICAWPIASPNLFGLLFDIMQCDSVGCDVDADEDKTQHSHSSLMPIPTAATCVCVCRYSFTFSSIKNLVLASMICGIWALGIWSIW